MSRNYYQPQSLRLPPVGFEGLVDDSVRPLKKRKRKNRLKAVALASNSFGTEGNRSNNAAHFYQHQQEPHIDNHPAPDLTDRGQYRGVGELRLRRAPGTLTEKSKRFTISDLEGDKPYWLKNQSVAVQQMARQDVKDLLRKLYANPERERIDYILVHKKPENEDDPEEKRKKKKRDRFEKLLQEEGFSIEHETIGDSVYSKLHCSFWRLCKEADSVKLQMPLKNMEIQDDEPENKLNNFIEKTFVTDDEVDFVSAPFEQLKLHLFDNCETPDLFFRSALRGLLTDHCLKNVDLRKLPRTPQYYYHTDDDDDPNEDILSKQEVHQRRLPYLLMKGVYTDAFTLHDESEDDHKESAKFEEDEKIKDKQAEEDAKSVLDLYGDPRHDLNVTWPNVLKFQPLWKIRNYFGEEIALYFAWAGMFITTIMIPMLIGLSVFFYGMYCSISGNCRNGTETANTTVFSNTTTSGGIAELIDTAFSVLAVIKEAFDNNGTWVYAVSICIWSTLFLEIWKRKNAVLAYEWDVVDFDDVEPDRPEYFGTDKRKDPVTREEIPFYPFKYKCLKYTVSFVTFLFMLLVVLAIIVGIIAYRVIIKINYCGDLGGAGCFMVTTVCSSLINAILILILGKVYEKLAVILTNWENHRTASAYRNGLIIKMFVFQFANCYGSLYYIAFFRDPTILDLGDGLFRQAQLSDSCGTTCMPDLSFQVLVLLIIKPLPRILKDVILPWAIRKVKAVCCKKNSSSVDPETSDEEPDLKTKFLEAEQRKPPLKDFTLNEYTEKVIQYGFIVLFAAAMPLGPLIAILFNTLDRVLDSKRLLWMYRRPIANIAQDIGMWQGILEFLNIAAVITNGFLIAYVSDWGKDNFAGQQLWFVLVFEHVLFILKYSLAIIIPDVPQKIRIAMRKEKFTVAKILETGIFVKEFKKQSGGGDSQSALRHRMTPEGARTADGVDPDSVTARNVVLNSRQSQHGGQEAQDVPDGGYIGDAENDSPRKDAHDQQSPVRQRSTAASPPTGRISPKH